MNILSMCGEIQRGRKVTSLWITTEKSTLYIIAVELSWASILAHCYDTQDWRSSKAFV